MSWELIVFLLAAAGIAAGCLLPPRWLPPLPHDKWLHFGAFGLLSVLALRIEPDWTWRLAWLGALLVAGFAIEVLQQRVPGRSFCWRDMAANAAGIATVAAAALLLEL